MEQKEMTSAEIDLFIAAVQEDSGWSDADKAILIQKAEARRPKAETPQYATREELDRVMPHLEAGFRPTPKPESEKSSDEKQMDRFIDEVMRHMW